MSPAMDLRRLATFSALALFVALSWVGMLAAAPLARTAASCLPVIAVGLLLIPLRRSRIGDLGGSIIAAGALLAATVAGLIIVGLPLRLLAPGGWSELVAGIDLGFAGIGEGVSYPYGGVNEWSRLVMLLGAPLLVGTAALCSFLPLRRDAAESRLLGLAVLVGGYGMAMTIYGPDHALLRGVALLAGVTAWIWLPVIGRRAAGAALALLALALVFALPASAGLKDDEGLVDYRSWSWSTGPGTAFNWDHSYGPIDWDRSSETVLLVESADPNYWKATVLDDFNGLSWSNSGTVRDPLELPASVEGIAVNGTFREDWLTSAKVTIDRFKSDLIVGPGSGRRVVSGIDTDLSGDRAAIRALLPLAKGDSYDVRGYAPDPSAVQMRSSGWAVPATLDDLVTVGVPTRAGGPVLRVSTLGIREGRAEQARQAFAASPYARMAALSDRLTADSASAYDAVKEIETHLLDNYSYSETPPERPLPLESFLFEDRIGYCQQFSGAMALMLRMQGIPARIATGFSPGVHLGGDRFEVRALDAHSWVEVYFAGIGWVPFDPTPPASPAQLRTGGAAAPSSAASSLGPLLFGATGFLTGGPDRSTAIESGNPGQELPATAPTPSADAGHVPLYAALGLLGTGVLLATPGVWRRSRERRQGREVAIEARVTELDGALRRLGRHQDAATLLGLEDALRSRTEPLAVSYVERLRRLRYGRDDAGSLPSGAERRALRRRLSDRGGLRARLLGYRAIPPLSPRL